MSISGQSLLSRNSQSLSNSTKSKVIFIGIIFLLLLVVLLHGYMSGVALFALTFAVLPAFIIVVVVIAITGYCHIGQLTESILSMWILIPALMYLLGYIRVDGLLASAFGQGTIAYFAMFSFVRAALLEEILKYLVVISVLAVTSSSHTNSSRVGQYATIAACAGASFAAHENVQYIYLSSNDISTQLGIMRALTTTPLHTFCAMIAGMLTAKCLDKEIKIRAIIPVLSLFIPVILHGAYDMIVLTLTGRQALIGAFAVLALITVIAEVILIDSNNQGVEDSNNGEKFCQQQSSTLAINNQSDNNSNPFDNSLSGALIV